MQGRGTAPVLAGVTAVGLVLGLAGCEVRVPGLAASRVEPVAEPIADPRAGADGFAVRLRVIVEDGATLVLVPLRVNGRGPFEFILDTGASTSTVDRRLVGWLGLPRTGETARVTGVTGSAVVPVVKLADWTLGGRPLRGRRLTVTDIGDDRVAGLLGSDELRRFGAVTVDFRRQRLVLRAR
ncbi:retropepsin-like aspartic protease [Thermomonospora echinospora]|uniref:retropepsin-like aspartic protease n=1 Tax=Thermomonospora echinospora TaxID=1992 RepID=UPI00135739B7|nr:retropepsin-like aspartic protease [Thermomonospora echinospora]